MINIDQLGLINLSNTSPIIVSITILLLSLMLYRPAAWLIINRLKHLVSKTKTGAAIGVCDSFTKPLRMVLLVTGIYIATKTILLETEIDSVANQVLETLVTFALFWGLYRSAEPLSLAFDALTTIFHDQMTDEIRKMSIVLLKIITIFFGTMAILQVWSINIFAFLGGLGLLGMMAALAAQDTLKNFFGSFAIYIDQKFSAGDYIQTKDIEGTVESIGLRTTTIRQPDRGESIVPNSLLVSTPITNYSRRPLRRVLWHINLYRDTPAQKLEQALQQIRTWLKDHPHVESQSTHVPTIVRLEQFKEGSISMRCQFFVTKPSFTDYIAIKEEAILAFKKIFEQTGVSLA